HGRAAPGEIFPHDLREDPQEEGRAVLDRIADRRLVHEDRSEGAVRTLPPRSGGEGRFAIAGRLQTGVGGLHDGGASSPPHPRPLPATRKRVWGGEKQINPAPPSSSSAAPPRDRARRGNATGPAATAASGRASPRRRYAGRSGDCASPAPCGWNRRRTPCRSD